jgi:hypothetical protein
MQNIHKRVSKSPSLAPLSPFHPESLKTQQQFRRKEKTFSLSPRGKQKTRKIYEGVVAAGLLKNSRTLPDKNVAKI